MTWPLGNRAESLQIDFFYIQRQVGQAVGIGYNSAEWDDEQIQIVQEIIDAGVRQYYFPPPIKTPYQQDVGLIHEWSFMRPTWYFETAADQRVYQCPEDFERPIGHISYQDTDNDYYGPITQVSPNRLQYLENRTTYTTAPELFALEVEHSTGHAPQRQLLTLHPTPDAVYKLKLRYQALARRLTSDQPYTLGNQIHAMGILESCLAIAEVRTTGAQGGATERFLMNLTGNIIRDQERQGKILGYNGNGAGRIVGRADLRDVGGIFYQDMTYSNTSYTG